MSSTLLQAFPSHVLLGSLLPLLRAVLHTMLDQTTTTTYDKPNEFYSQYDFIVVGSGYGGSVVAGRLAEVPWLRVLVIEAGGPPPPESHTPAMAILSPLNHNWNYTTVPQRQALGNFENQQAILPMPRVVGGGSTMGGMLYMRGSTHDYDLWDALGNTGWDYDDIMYYFRKAENYLGKDSQETESSYGRGGPLAVTPDTSKSSLLSAFLSAGREMGYDTVDLNGPNDMGFTRPHYTIKSGVRSSTAEAYLGPAISWSNLHILHSAVVTKIQFEDKKAVGVLFEYEGKSYQVSAEREVIVSAGAINTPKLLMLSGIGPQQHLRTHKVEVVTDLQGVGRNLEDHVGVFGLSWTLPGTPPNHGPFFNTTAMHQYVKHRQGPFSSPPGQCVTGWVKAGKDSVERQPDISVTLIPVSFHRDQGLLTPFTYGMDKQAYQEYYSSVIGRRGFTMLVSLLHPSSRGSVTLQSADPHDPPLIDPRYLADQQDVNSLLQGIQFAIRLGNTEALQSLGAQFHDQLVPGCLRASNNEEYWRCYIKHMASSLWHPVGTCRMGPSSDPLAVVDNKLRVYGVEGLRVVDASVMPIIVSAGTAATTVMIAEKAADTIKTDWDIDVDYGDIDDES